MQPTSQSVNQNSFAEIISPVSDNSLQNIEDKLIVGTVLDKTIQRNYIESHKNTPNAKKSNISQETNYQQSKSQLPQILDIAKTQQTHERHSVLKHTIQSTIQQLLQVYKNKNSVLSPKDQSMIKNEIFERFAFIYNEMNEVKGDIENAINFLNEGVNIPSKERPTPAKRISLPHGRITQKSQSFEESSSMKEEQDNKNQEQLSGINCEQASLEQRYQEKSNQNSMQLQE